MYAGEIPAVRCGAGAQFFGRLGERDVNARFAASYSLEKELQTERRLSRTGMSFDKVYAMSRQPATKKMVEPCNARRRSVVEHRPGRSCHGLLHLSDLSHYTSAHTSASR